MARIIGVALVSDVRKMGEREGRRKGVERFLVFGFGDEVRGLCGVEKGEAGTRRGRMAFIHLSYP